MTDKKQRTFYVNGEKIQIVSEKISYMRNFAGWRVKVNGKQYKFFTLHSRQEVEDKAYVKWVKENVSE